MSGQATVQTRAKAFPMSYRSGGAACVSRSWRRCFARTTSASRGSRGSGSARVSSRFTIFLTWSCRILPPPLGRGFGANRPVDDDARRRCLLSSRWREDWRGVDRHDPIHPTDRVGLSLNHAQQLVPRAIGREAMMPLPHRLPRPEPPRKITPRRPGPMPEHDALDHLTMITPRTTKSCVTKQVTRPIRNREAPVTEPQLA